MNIMQRQFGPKTPRGEPRESHREISLGDQEKYLGKSILPPPHERISWSHRENSHGHQEISHREISHGHQEKSHLERILPLFSW